MCQVLSEGSLVSPLDCSYRTGSVLFVDIVAQSHLCGTAETKINKKKRIIILLLPKEVQDDLEPF